MDADHGSILERVMAVQRRGGGGLVALAVGIALVVAGGAWAANDRPHVRVSQIDQAFRPNELSVGKGTIVDIVNDDGDLLHHAFIESPTFSFDSGDQEPGMTASVAFNVSGTFTVLCGIHPRMKLKVRVE